MTATMMEHDMDPERQTRTFTKTTFTKAMQPVVLTNIHGIDVSKKWTS